MSISIVSSQFVAACVYIQYPGQPDVRYLNTVASSCEVVLMQDRQASLFCLPIIFISKSGTDIYVHTFTHTSSNMHHQQHCNTMAVVTFASSNIAYNNRHIHTFTQTGSNMQRQHQCIVTAAYYTTAVATFIIIILAATLHTITDTYTHLQILAVALHSRSSILYYSSGDINLLAAMLCTIADTYTYLHILAAELHNRSSILYCGSSDIEFQQQQCYVQ